jgi:hypothetical protein
MLAGRRAAIKELIEKAGETMTLQLLEIVAAVANGIVAVVSASWYAKSKNAGHLFFMICAGCSAAVFAYLAFVK